MSESQEIEFKSRFDHTDQLDWLRLIKEIVAMANAEGGTLYLGRREDGTAPGLDSATVAKLDPAIITDKVDSYIAPDHIELEVRQYKADSPDRKVVVVRVAAFPDPPLVFTKSGNAHDSNGKQTTVFHKHSVVRRRGTKAEPATRSDYRHWIKQAEKRAYETLALRIAEVSRLPLDKPIKIVVDEEGELLDEASVLFRNALRAYSFDPNRLLPKEDLIRLFLIRDTLPRGDKEGDLLIQSALRKKPTLFFWIDWAGFSSGRLGQLLREAIAKSDRDKSDAGIAILAVAALTQPAAEFGDLRAALAASKYKHFQEAAMKYHTPAHTMSKLGQVFRCKFNGRPLARMPKGELVRCAEEVARDIMATGYSQPRARLLSALGQAFGLMTFLDDVQLKVLYDGPAPA